MNIHFERRTDRPDAEGRCAIHLRVIFDGQRLRVATGERCTAADWNDKSNWFRKSFPDLDNASDRLKTLRNRVEDSYNPSCGVFGAEKRLFGLNRLGLGL